MPNKKKAVPITSSYLETVFDLKQYTAVLKRAKTKLRVKRRTLRFDAIAFRGSSGAALAFPLSVALQVPLIHSRKEASHTSIRVEGATRAKRILIVDDLVCTGDTMQRIESDIRKWCAPGAKIVGVALYNSNNPKDLSHLRGFENAKVFAV